MHREVPVAQYAPAEVKKALVGNGRASKEQVSFMVRARLSLTEAPQEDAADALAVALCHAARRPTAPPPAGGSSPRPRATGAAKSWADFIAQNPDRLR